VRDHETFEMLSKADLTALYGPGVSQEWIGRIRQTLDEGDHTLVRAMHGHLLTLKEKNEDAAEARRKESAPNAMPVGLVIFGVAIAILSVVVFAVSIFMGS
jgi:subtilase family serine protease